MSKLVIMGAMLLAMSTATSYAAGLSLNWDHCEADGPVRDRTSDCVTSLRALGTMVGSFTVPSDVLAVRGLEVALELATAGPSLPAWWMTSCRTPFAVNAVIEATALNCYDWSSGAVMGAVVWYLVGLNGPNTARIVAGLEVPGSGVDLSAIPPLGTEYFAFNIVLSSARSSGAGLCAGCTTPACIMFNSLKVVAGLSTAAILTYPQHSASNIVTWQGGAGLPWPYSSRCEFTPTQKSTWGSVKALYR